MGEISAYIIIADTVKALGFRYLFSKYFGVKAQIMQAFDIADINDKTSSSIYIVSPETYLFNHDFFMTRRMRTILVSSVASDDILAVSPQMDETAIVEVMQKALEALTREESNPRQCTLTQREIDVLRLVALGHINKEIAEMLSISFNTVLTHRKNISSKLGIKSVSGLGLYAIMNGYISEKDIKRLNS